MVRTYADITIASTPTITMNRDLMAGLNMYIVTNVKDALSDITTRRQAIPKQGAHGSHKSLSFIDERVMRFEGEIHASTVADRITMESNLKKAVLLATDQSFSGDDGYRKYLILDEDGIEKQIYCKLVSLSFTRFRDGMSNRSRFALTVVAEDDPYLVATELTEFDNGETTHSTTAKIKDGSLPTIKDGSLPTIKDDLQNEFIVENEGVRSAPPVITITGACTSPVIQNVTTGKTMTFQDLVLATDDTIEIDVNSFSATKTSNGVETDVVGYLTEDSDWIYIAAGENTITLFDDSPDALVATINVAFRSVW